MIVTLRKFLDHSRPAYDYFFRNRLLFKPEDNYILSALGARVCYSLEHPLKLLREDKRIIDGKKRAEFLTHLYRMKHFSVFAHSPIFFETISCSKPIILYKLWRYEAGNIYYCANLRHLVEALFLNGCREEDFATFLWNIQFGEKGSVLDYFDKVWWMPFDGCKVGLKKEGLDQVTETPGVLCFYIERYPWHWFSFVVHGVSRVMTHQFVRHTWLNFSQRSHRYAEVDNVIVPGTVEKVYVNQLVFEGGVSDALCRYKYLVDCGIPKEDARFIAPAGAATTIMASGPLFVWQDFVEKRSGSNAQWEIRKVAYLIRQVLESVTMPGNFEEDEDGNQP